MDSCESFVLNCGKRVIVGILSTIFIVSQIGISFFAGKIAHAVHGRNVVLLAIAASSLSWLTLFLSYKTGILYLAYVLGGLSSGLFEPIGNSLVARRSSSNNRGTVKAELLNLPRTKLISQAGTAGFE